MSLAEPRKRRKNPMHSVNLSAPNHWTNDDSKFGQRMLEKFGWSKGSGLGKNEQGISEIIRVQPKVSPTGLGFIANNADDWFKAGEDYSRLLSQLTEKFDQYQALSAEANNSKNSKKSLEQNSLNSRSRVHYHKFTKGKDLAQYKSEELACILGKGVKNNEQISESLNMKEYFKAKKEKKKLKLDRSGSSSNEDFVDIDNDENSEKTTYREDSEINDYVEEPKINFTPAPKKTKYGLNVSEEIEMSLSNKYDNFEVKKKSKDPPSEDFNDTDHTNKKSTKLTTNENIKQEKKSSSKNILSSNVDDLKQLKKKKSKPLSDDSLNEIEQTIKKKQKVLANAADDKRHSNAECDSDDYKKNHKQESVGKNSELDVTHKYQNLVELLIENSSAGKKYSKELPSSLFDKKINEFAKSVKNQFAKKVNSVKTKPVNIEGTSVKLNPDDKDFIKNFEAQKSEVLKNIRTQQEWIKYKNDTSQFVAKHGDVLFFGSNINDIKGYGEW